MTYLLWEHTTNSRKRKVKLLTHYILNHEYDFRSFRLRLEVMTLLNKQLNIIIKLSGAILKQGSSNSDRRNNKTNTASYGFTSYQINTIL